MTYDHIDFSPDDLAAFADDQASLELIQRINVALQRDPKLAVHIAELRAARLAFQNALSLDALNAPAMPASLQASQKRRLPNLVMPMALAASVLLGMVLMNTLQPKPEKPGWIDQVASYQALYVEETLAGTSQDPAKTQAVLAASQPRLPHGLDTAPEIEGMDFKRAQILAIGDRTLIQLAYLSKDGAPYALCIVRVGKDDHSVEAMQTHNLAAASWVSGGLGYVLIGGSDTAHVSNLASELSEQI